MDANRIEYLNNEINSLAHSLKFDCLSQGQKEAVKTKIYYCLSEYKNFARLNNGDEMSRFKKDTLEEYFFEFLNKYVDSSEPDPEEYLFMKHFNASFCFEMKGFYRKFYKEIARDESKLSNNYIKTVIREIASEIGIKDLKIPEDMKSNIAQSKIKELFEKNRASEEQIKRIKSAFSYRFIDSLERKTERLYNLDEQKSELEDIQDRYPDDHYEPNGTKSDDIVDPDVFGDKNYLSDAMKQMFQDVFYLKDNKTWQKFVKVYISAIIAKDITTNSGTVDFEDLEFVDKNYIYAYIEKKNGGSNFDEDGFTGKYLGITREYVQRNMTSVKRAFDDWLSNRKRENDD